MTKFLGKGICLEFIWQHFKAEIFNLIFNSFHMKTEMFLKASIYAEYCIP